METLKTLSTLINQWGFLSSLILDPSRRPNTKESSRISEEKRVSSLISEDLGLFSSLISEARPFSSLIRQETLTN